MNSSLRLMASWSFSGNSAHLSAMSPVRTDACKRGSPGKAKREAGAGKEISLPSTFRLKTTTAEMASLRPATMAGRPRRSAGRHPHIRSPAARRHRNAPRMPGHSAPPARRRPAPMGCGAPAAGQRGGRGGVVCGRGRNPTLRLWPTIFSGKIDVFPGDRRSRLISSMTSVAPA